MITKDKVCNKLGQLKDNNTPGPDRLSPKLLKEIKMEISEPLFAIFNRSLQDSNVPEDLFVRNPVELLFVGNINRKIYLSYLDRKLQPLYN